MQLRIKSWKEETKVNRTRVIVEASTEK